MYLNEEEVLEALLRENWFPRQREKEEEFPPVFSSESLSIETAKQIYDKAYCESRKYDKFDYVNCTSTRFNNVHRTLSIPHPKSYIDLCFCISENWKSIKYIQKNTKSLIKPQKHQTDARILLMNYENEKQKKLMKAKKSFSKKFLVKTDISNFFPSLYTHTIPWSLVGIEDAKKERGNKKIWYNKLDRCAQAVRRGETNGVPIGPGTSNILAEIILAKIDEKLPDSVFRYIDDYHFYAESYSEAEDFLLNLGLALEEFKLKLNIKKTSIKQLPSAYEEMWVSELSSKIPSLSAPSDVDKILHLIDYAVSIHREEPDGSILKYAINSVAWRVKGYRKNLVIKRILELAFHYPVLLPSFRLIGQSYNNFKEKRQLQFTPQNYEPYFKKLVKENCRHKRTDAICWALFYMLKSPDSNIDTETANQVIESKDCLSITMLLLDKTLHEDIKTFAEKEILNKNDLYLKDNYWVLLYEMYARGIINNPYNDDATFSILKNNHVSFLQAA